MSDRVVLLAADHRARGIITVERYDTYLSALAMAMPFCDGILASAKPLADLVARGNVAQGQRTYLSVNRTGLSGSVFELDDRMVASVERAATDGYDGVKIMTRIDKDSPHTAEALELLGRVLEESRDVGLDVLVEPLTWVGGAGGRIDRSVDGIIAAAVIAHDLGSPMLKVPVPEAAPGASRVEAVARVVGSVGVPVLFLGGPHTGDRASLLAEVADAVEGGGAGLAIGRTIYQDPDPAGMARQVAELVHGSP